MSARRSLTRRGLLPIVGAIVANLVVLGLAVSVLESGGFDPFGVVPVALASGIGAIGATVTYAVVAQLRDRPDRLFVALPAVAPLRSFVTLPEAVTLEAD